VDIVLGVSITTTAVHLVLVEGESADGATIDHDILSLTDRSGLTAEQLVSGVLGTLAIASTGGHRLRAVGVAFARGYRAAAEELRDDLTACGFNRVLLASELQAAEALARAVGRKTGYVATGVVSIQADAATVAVVPSDAGDGRGTRVLTAMLNRDRPTESRQALTELVCLLDTDDDRPDGIYVVSADVDLTGVAEFLGAEVSVPVTTPDQPELALARGAALTAASQFGELGDDLLPPDGELLFVPRTATAPRAIADTKPSRKRRKHGLTVPILT
jgi:hypothetical protein